MNMPTSFFKLFVTFFRIGLFTFGGGYAMIPLIENDVVEKNGWLQKGEFIDLLAVAQSAPGVFAVNMSVFVGYRLRGVAGALSAAFGCVMPSVVIILLIALFFQRFRHIEVVNNIFLGIRPVVVALIAVPVFNVAKSANISMRTIWVPVLSALLIVAFGVSPIYVIIVAGAAGFIWGKIGRNRV
ncbi:MAG: chromate transporter [Bacteroidaceae bacterium]|nr:chromate transporter [Bacteroidaceae bacterium]